MGLFLFTEKCCESFPTCRILLNDGVPTTKMFLGKYTIFIRINTHKIVDVCRLYAMSIYVV